MTRVTRVGMAFRAILFSTMLSLLTAATAFAGGDGIPFPK